MIRSLELMDLWNKKLCMLYFLICMKLKTYIQITSKQCENDNYHSVDRVTLLTKPNYTYNSKIVRTKNSLTLQIRNRNFS